MHLWGTGMNQINEIGEEYFSYFVHSKNSRVFVSGITRIQRNWKVSYKILSITKSKSFFKDSSLFKLREHISMILVKISVASMPYIISICAPHIILSAMSTVQCISMSLSWQPTASNQSEIYVGNLKSTSAWLAHQSKAKVLCLAKSMQKEQRRWEKLMSRATARGLKWLTATWDGEKPATSEPNRYQPLPAPHRHNLHLIGMQGGVTWRLWLSGWVTSWLKLQSRQRSWRSTIAIKLNQAHDSPRITTDWMKLVQENRRTGTPGTPRTRW